MTCTLLLICAHSFVCLAFILLACGYVGYSRYSNTRRSNIVGSYQKQDSDSHSGVFMEVRCVSSVTVLIISLGGIGHYQSRYERSFVCNNHFNKHLAFPLATFAGTSDSRCFYWDGLLTSIE